MEGEAVKPPENWRENLKPGDEVVINGSRGFRPEKRIAKVEKVTKLHVIVAGAKFSKRHGRTAGGSNGYDLGPSIDFPTPALREQIALDRIRYRALNAIEKLRMSPRNGGTGGDDRPWSRLEADALREIAKASTPDAFDAWITRLRNAAAIEVLVAALERLERDDSTGRRETARWLTNEIAELRRALNPDVIPGTTDTESRSS